VKRCGLAACILLAVVGVGCGKEGPPLPPLVRLPSAPAEVVAARRGNSVDITLKVPAANTDGSRPANVQRVDVYAITTPLNVTDEQLLKFGTKVGSVDVKAPRDPNETVEADEPESDVEPPEGKGLDQGGTASLSEALSSAASVQASLTPPTRRGQTVTPPAAVPLQGAPLHPASRVYAAVGISTRGRHGPFSKRATVPLVPPPPAPSETQVTYDESSVVVTWQPPPARMPIQQPADGDVLESKPIGFSFPSTAFNVYELKDKTETRLTTPPTTEAQYADKRIEWGTERCYVVRTIEIFDALSAESEASQPRCVMLVDTFPPKPPGGATAVATEGAINLIWEPNTESDLKGYLVLRAPAGSTTFAPITPEPIQPTTFTDTVQPGIRYVYAVRAVDTAGNQSEPSQPTDATEAR